VISGKTLLIAHLGFPTETFKSPLIYNPFFEKAGIDAVVVPMGVQAVDFPSFLPELFKLNNIRGALVTMPHKMSAIELADEVSPTARIAGAANVLRKRDDGSLVADMFDGEGFVRGVLRKGRKLAQTSALIIGAGGVGSAIAASLAAAGVTRMGLVDAMGGAAESLGGRLSGHYPDLTVRTGSADPTGYDLVVNATPLGMNDGDPLPIDMNLLSPTTFVGEVVMKSAVTPFLRAARERGCETQVGVDMLFEQVPANLEFLGFGTATPDEVRKLAQIEY
jgi:shikimate dehydrogenase